MSLSFRLHLKQSVILPCRETHTFYNPDGNQIKLTEITRSLLQEWTNSGLIEINPLFAQLDVKISGARADIREAAGQNSVWNQNIFTFNTVNKSSILTKPEVVIIGNNKDGIVILLSLIRFLIVNFSFLTSLLSQFDNLDLSFQAIYFRPFCVLFSEIAFLFFQILANIYSGSADGDSLGSMLALAE